MTRPAFHSSAVYQLPLADDATRQVGVLPGCWTLVAGNAFSLRANQHGDIYVSRGRVWLTFEDASLDYRVRAGDYFLDTGDSMTLAAGQTVVMESFACDGVFPASFGWEPAMSVQAVRQRGAGAYLLSGLRKLPAFLAGAAARLVRGFTGGVAV